MWNTIKAMFRTLGQGLTGLWEAFIKTVICPMDGPADPTWDLNVMLARELNENTAQLRAYEAKLVQLSQTSHKLVADLTEKLNASEARAAQLEKELEKAKLDCNQLLGLFTQRAKVWADLTTFVNENNKLINGTPAYVPPQKPGTPLSVAMPPITRTELKTGDAVGFNAAETESPAPGCAGRCGKGCARAKQKEGDAGDTATAV